MLQGKEGWTEEAGSLIFLMSVSYSRMTHVRYWELDDDSEIWENPSEDFDLVMSVREFILVGQLLFPIECASFILFICLSSLQTRSGLSPPQQVGACPQLIADFHLEGWGMCWQEELPHLFKTIFLRTSWDGGLSASWVLWRAICLSAFNLP